MGLTERHWFENDDVPENYEWSLEDAVYNSAMLNEQKAIPIIHEYRDTDLKIVQCGNCLAQLTFEKQKYCAECGNKIDWSILTEREEGR